MLDADDVRPTTELEPGSRNEHRQSRSCLQRVRSVSRGRVPSTALRHRSNLRRRGILSRHFSAVSPSRQPVRPHLGSYGPFYWSFIGLIYRLTGHNPTLTVDACWCWRSRRCRLGFFAAAVWHVTRNLLFSILCQVTTFCVLILVAGHEPISPGSTIVLLLSILVYALASYSVEQRDSLLVIAGVATGALDDDQDQCRDLCHSRAGCRVDRRELGLPEMAPQHERSRSRSPALHLDVSTDLSIGYRHVRVPRRSVDAGYVRRDVC